MKNRKTITIILIISWMIIVFLFSDQPSIESSSTSGKVIEIIIKTLNINISDENIQELQLPIRKLAHFTIYAIGGILILLHIDLYKMSEKKKLIISGLIGIAYAVTDEVHQLFVIGRSGEIRDVCIDSLGIVTGLIILLYIDKIMKRKKKTK